MSCSITFAVLTILALCLIVYAVLRSLGWISGSPERYRIWRRHRAQQRDQQLLQRGWLALLDGRLGLAEKELTKLHHKSKSKETRLIAGRKSTRLNSSHVAISYAVFCLKKKKNNNSVSEGA